MCGSKVNRKQEDGYNVLVSKRIDQVLSVSKSRGWYHERYAWRMYRGLDDFSPSITVYSFQSSLIFGGMLGEVLLVTYCLS